MINLDSMISSPEFLTGGRTYRQVLEAARDLLSDPERWTQGVFARDENGVQVRPKDASACKWCLLGAVAICSNDIGISPPQLLNYLNEMMKHIYGDDFANLGDLNDYVSHSVLLEFMDRALQGFDMPPGTIHECRS